MFRTLCCLVGCLAVVSTQAAEFQITPIKLPGGTVIGGRISTDGTLGPLSPANLTAWQVVVRNSSSLNFTPAQAGGPQTYGVAVSADGRRMTVRTSPDGVSDGGRLAFGSFGPGPEHGVQVADFTAYNAAGGSAFYVSGANFDWQPLGAPNASRYLAARAPAGSPVFTLVPVQFPGGATMSGSITTDGSTGPISPSQILSWKIAVKTVTETLYEHSASGGNSVVLPASGQFSTDGSQLFVARPDGYLGFGIPPAPPRRGAGAVLADFSASAPSQGQAGWFDPFGLQFAPLHFTGTLYPVATVLP